MRAVAVVPGRRTVGLIALPEPQRQMHDEVLVRVREVGVCGTDREIARFDYGAPPKGEETLVLGHEALAEVVAAGADSRFASGDLVVPLVRLPCPEQRCRPCRAGRQDFCATGRHMERGINGAHGFMTELFVDAEARLVAVPADLADVAVLVEPLTIARKALEQVWQVQSRLAWATSEDPANAGAGLHALVLGAGPVGLLGAMALRLSGFTVTVYSRSPAPNPKGDLAQSIGARYVSSEEVGVPELVELAGAPDLVYEAAGVSAMAVAVLGALAPNGIFVLAGVPASEAARLVDAAELLRRMVLGNQVLIGTVNAGRPTYEAAVEALTAMARRWPSALRQLISHRHPLADAPELLHGRQRGIKSVLSVGAG